MDKPSLSVAWGWTWRIFLCLLAIGSLCWIVAWVFSSVNAYNDKLDRQAERNSQPIGH